MDVSSI